MTLLKQPKFKSKKYRIWISEKRCVICGAYPPCDPAHQNLVCGKMGGKEDDKSLLPFCRDCHMMSETAINGGFMRVWKKKRPELWVDENGKKYTEKTAKPAEGKLCTKQDLREYLAKLCEIYFHFWEAENQPGTNGKSMEQERLKLWL